MTVSETLLFLDDRGGFEGCWSGVLLVTASLDLCSSDVFFSWLDQGVGFGEETPEVERSLIESAVPTPNTACRWAVSAADPAPSWEGCHCTVHT